ncbi:hypothetical protein A9Q81_05615 [Gammaproteobacteria bacterium 42_54_T18]|nr:hypothetical protein A9Q81_05615 [Gammaproteobacteria bacterium 42_54_T18]
MTQTSHTRHTIRSSLSLLALLYLFSLIGCSTPPDAQQINDHIYDIAENIENKNTNDILDRLSHTFSAKHLRTKEDTQRLLMLSFLKYKRISVLLTNVKVSINEIYLDQATATFNVIATSNTTGGASLIPNEGQAYRFTTNWEKIDDEWYLQQAQWKRAFE